MINIKRTTRQALLVVLSLMWLLFIHITTGIPNPWVDIVINIIVEFLMKGLMVWNISEILLKYKEKKGLCISMAIVISIILSFGLPYLDKILWVMKDEVITLPFVAQIDIANYIYFQNEIIGMNIIKILFWFVFYDTIFFVSYFRMKKNENLI